MVARPYLLLEMTSLHCLMVYCRLNMTSLLLFIIVIGTLAQIPCTESASNAQCIADGKRINAMKAGMAWAKPGMSF